MSFFDPTNTRPSRSQLLEMTARVSLWIVVMSLALAISLPVPLVFVVALFGSWRLTKRARAMDSENQGE